MRYFSITQGLRGAYMPESVFVMKTETRRELKRVFETEASQINSGDLRFYGLSKEAITNFASRIWKGEARGRYPLCLPYGDDPKNKNLGLMVWEINRAEFRKLEKELDQ